MSDIIFSFGDFEIEIPQNSTFVKGKLSENFGDDLDQKINTYLNRNDSQVINSFILPVSLTGNFFDFSGLIFAHHIRLSRNLKCCNVKIAIYGTLEITELLRLTPLSKILITENVFYIDVAKYSFEEFKELINEKSNKINFQSILNQIQILPPSNYEDNHHSVDNEFALIQWSIQNGSYDSLPDDFKKEFDSRLYFKYLRAKNPISHLEIEATDNIQVEKSVNIILIDDEAKKGWNKFYELFFQKISDKIHFRDINIDFKDANSKDRDEFIANIVTEIAKNDPDIILLDLRLMDVDFINEKEPNQLTGIKILEKIKELNKGIQVIITTASNKVWNFKYANQKGAIDFVIKDGFENPEKKIQDLKRTIQFAAKRAVFLKGIGKSIGEIKDLINQNKYINKSISKFTSNLNLAFELLDLSCEIDGKAKYFAYSYLQFFICIEEFLKMKEIFSYENNKCYVNNTILVARKEDTSEQWETSIRFVEKPYPSYYTQQKNRTNKLNPNNTDFKMASVLIYMFNLKDSNSLNWPQIREIRNQKVAHPEKGNVKPENINQLLKFINYIFDSENLADKIEKMSLTDSISTEDLKKLKDKLQN